MYLHFWLDIGRVHVHDIALEKVLFASVASKPCRDSRPRSLQQGTGRSCSGGPAVPRCSYGSPLAAATAPQSPAKRPSLKNSTDHIQDQPRRPTESLRLFGAGRGTIRVGYADRTHKKTWFNKETSFGISFGRIPIVLAEFQWEVSKSAAGRPEADFKADFDMFCMAKEDTSARRKNFHVFKWYFFAAEKFIV